VFTWIVVGYQLISEKVTSARAGYQIWAVLALDFLMALFWLASLGANAQLRASFTTPVNIESCYNDGSTISSNHCTVSSAKVKRAAVADALGLALMSAVAGVSALEWYVPVSGGRCEEVAISRTEYANPSFLPRLLFVATLIFHGHTFRLWHQENKKPSADNATVEMKLQGTPMLAAQTTGQPAHPQYTDQQQYQSQMYPPHELHQQQQQQAPAYPPQQQPQQQAYSSPQATPVPGQPYYPPQQQQPPQQQPPQQQPPQQQPPQQQQQQQPAPYAAYPDQSQYQQHQQQQQQAYSPHATPVPGQPYYPPQELQHP
jgi:hypothetical protein